MLIRNFNFLCNINRDNICSYLSLNRGIGEILLQDIKSTFFIWLAAVL